MTEEDILRRQMEMIMILKNSHYGLLMDIGCDYDRLNCPKPPIYIGPVKVKSLKERLEEATMHEDCYFCIKRDICTKDVPKPCKYRYTEDERKADQASDIYGYILAGMYLPKTYLKKKEEDKMNATSTETFKDIIAIDFELQTFPNPDVQDKFIVSATNRDDIFCFVFEGPYIMDACRKTGLLNGWEKDQRIRELEKKSKDISNDNALLLETNKKLKEENEKLKKENEKLKDKLENVEPFRALERTIKEKQQLKEEYEEKLDVLQRKYHLERAANEAQRKFIKEYAGKDTEVTFNYAIDSVPITYGLYDKDYIDELRKKNNNLIAENAELKAKLCYKAKSADDIKKLKEQIKKLESLKTPTIENFEESSDNVNHPSHYTGRYECIDVMQDVFGNEATDNFCLCNAFKYIWRASKKNGLEDVKKAVWYLNKYIEEAEKDGVSKGERV